MICMLNLYKNGLENKQVQGMNGGLEMSAMYMEKICSILYYWNVNIRGMVCRVSWTFVWHSMKCPRTFNIYQILTSEQDWESSSGKITGLHIKWPKCPHKGISTNLFQWACVGFLNKPTSHALLRIIPAHLLLKTQDKIYIKEYKCRKTQPTYL